MDMIVDEVDPTHLNVATVAVIMVTILPRTAMGADGHMMTHTRGRHHHGGIGVMTGAVAAVHPLPHVRKETQDTGAAIADVRQMKKTLLIADVQEMKTTLLVADVQEMKKTSPTAEVPVMTRMICHDLDPLTQLPLTELPLTELQLIELQLNLRKRMYPVMAIVRLVMAIAHLVMAIAHLVMVSLVLTSLRMLRGRPVSQLSSGLISQIDPTLNHTADQLS
ncbi:hypothetical protein DFH29DRAFT_392738 [Suillus ampliporus]|nr:hypothetical protein DFH29DRAFT_392738 [Suillus ampliporus]